MPPVIVLVLVEPPTLNAPCQVMVPSPSTTDPVAGDGGLGEVARAPTVVAHTAWFLPMTLPDASAIRLVKTMTSPSMFDWADFGLVLRTCLKVAPLSGSVMVMVRPPCAEAPWRA